MIFKKNKRSYSAKRNEQGIFLVLVGIMASVLVGLLALSVDVYMLMQSQLDMKVASQMMADGALRYLTDSKTWKPAPDGQEKIPPSNLLEVQTKMTTLVNEIYIIGSSKIKNLGDSNFEIDLKYGKYKLDDGTFTVENLPPIVDDRKVIDPGDPNITGDEQCPAVRVIIKTHSENSKIGAIFSKIYHQSKFSVNATGIAYFNPNSSEVSPYSFDH